MARWRRPTTRTPVLRRQQVGAARFIGIQSLTLGRASRRADYCIAELGTCARSSSGAFCRAARTANIASSRWDEHHYLRAVRAGETSASCCAAYAGCDHVSLTSWDTPPRSRRSLSSNLCRLGTILKGIFRCCGRKPKRHARPHSRLRPFLYRWGSERRACRPFCAGIGFWPQGKQPAPGPRLGSKLVKRRNMHISINLAGQAVSV